MDALTVMNLLFSLAILGASSWLLMLQRNRVWYWILCIVHSGALLNLSAYVWLKEATHWPGHFIIVSGLCVLLLFMCIYETPIITRTRPFIGDI